MSYDIYLRDPVTEDVCQVKGHLMTGGTYKAEHDPISGAFSPALDTDAHLNVTYNYSRYYYEATEGDERFAHDDGDGEVRYGIRGIYGKTGFESLTMLADMISRIRERYFANGDWVESRRERTYWLDTAGRRYDASEQLGYYLASLSHPERLPEDFDDWTEHTEPYVISEGHTDDYWEPTAANALRPLYQLMALAQMRPDGVWDGD